MPSFLIQAITEWAEFHHVEPLLVVLTSPVFLEKYGDAGQPTTSDKGLLLDLLAGTGDKARGLLTTRDAQVILKWLPEHEEALESGVRRHGREWALILQKSPGMFPEGAKRNHLYNKWKDMQKRRRPRAPPRSMRRPLSARIVEIRKNPRKRRVPEGEGSNSDDFAFHSSDGSNGADEEGDAAEDTNHVTEMPRVAAASAPYPVELKPCDWLPGHRGLFTTRDVEVDEVLSLYGGRMLDWEEYRELHERGEATHVFKVGKGRYLDGHPRFLYTNDASKLASMANEPPPGAKKNAHFKVYKGVVRLRAKKRIPKGEEVFAGYGGSYRRDYAR